MSRRDTIIISALVNAALLAVLFVTAVTSKDHVKEEAKMTAAAILEETSIDAKDLFSSSEEKMSTVASAEMVPQEAQKEFVSLVEESEKTKPVEPSPNVMYKLPQIANDNTSEPAKISQTPVKADTAKIVVKKGDSLEKIAKANKTTISEISKLNGLQNSFLRIGQELLVPNKALEKTFNKTCEKTSTILPVKSPAEYYTIKVGDNPYTIAIKHNVKLNDLLKLNGLDEKKARRLKPGDKLRIR